MTPGPVLFIAFAVTFVVLGGLAWLMRHRGVFVRIERQSPSALARRLKPHTAIYAPPGPGPFPAVILLHGCGGPRGVTEAYGRRCAEAGFIAFAPDSLALRGIGYREAVSKVCTGACLRAGERAGDVFAALEIARVDRRVDQTRIALAGWSHGAWTILDALTWAAERRPPPSLQRLPKAGVSGVKGVYAFYPYSGFLARSRGHDWPAGIRVEALLVPGDTVCDDADSVKMLEARRAAGSDTAWDWMEGATHGFDEPDHLPGSGLTFDRDLARKGEEKLLAFLKRTLL
ncbi:dienelactone hydrolase family protein [Hyphobacterium marinum]|uniref:Dienelactone hydrolase family protein n=1 Tax=Hyphobacterium marinum TaxID=3116574 RepID=A0ABU7LUU9_9PROT|nr:dienelactone hydrolase family protein [Hyphobacterium sp. Y6023]MEE2565325.1 dienelactone hydrolase family protein [Hyphobacterium sp. Y6023]